MRELGCKEVMEKFAATIDWAMVILNPLEPWTIDIALVICAVFLTDVIRRRMSRVLGIESLLVH